MSPAKDASWYEITQWAKKADVGEYLAEYKDDDLTDMSDSGSRCGFSDEEIGLLADVLDRRGLALSADDRGLVVQEQEP